MFQYISEPTRVTASTKTLLDVMYVKSNKNLEPFIIKSALSDHYIIGTNRSLNYTKPPQYFITGRSYRKYSFENAKPYYSRQRRDLIYELDVENAWKTLYKFMLNCANTLCPNRQILVRQNSPPWITKELYESLHERDVAFETAYTTNNPNDLIIAKNLRTSTKRDLRNARADFIQNNLKNKADNPRKFWEEINTLIKNTRKANKIELIDNDGNRVDKDKTPDFINNFFSSIGPTLASKLNHTCNVSSDDSSIIDIDTSDLSLHNPNATPSNPTYNYITESDLKKEINEIKIYKSSGIES